MWLQNKLRLPILAALPVLLLSPGRVKSIATQFDESPRIMGQVTAVTRSGYTVKTMNGELRSVSVDSRSRFYFLQPATVSQIRRGWGAHAIGSVSPKAIATRMLVLFPPASAAGAPPPEAGLTGVGAIASTKPLIIRLVHGARIPVRMNRTSRVVIARPMHFSRLHIGDQAMTFLEQTRTGMAARIVHVQASKMGMHAGPGAMGR